MFLAASVLVALSQEGPDLRWKPRIGEMVTYEYQLTSLDPKEAMKLTAYLDIKVTQVETSGFTAKTMSRGALISMLGQELKDTRNNPVTARYGLRGELIEILEGIRDRGAYDLGRTTKFIAPPQSPKSGETWTYEYPGDEGAAALKWTGKFEGMTTAGKAKVAMTLTESKPGRDPFVARGEWLVDPATGVPEALTAELRNIGGFKDNANFKISLLRLSEKIR